MTTTTENRDAIARAMGWTYKTMAGQSWWDHPEQLDSDTHPIPNTADAALDAFGRLLKPLGWDWERRQGIKGGKWVYHWWLNHSDPNISEIDSPDTGDFKADLFALIVKALEARKA